MNVALLAAAAATTFNLNCTGEMRVIDNYGDSTKPYSAAYRLDLSANKWCEGDCKALHDIVRIYEGQITLEDKNVDTPRQHDVVSNFINRETGEHRILAISGIGASKMGIQWKGKCVRSDFTGFPKLNTKF